MRRMAQALRPRGGFTLIEMLVVMAIIGVLAGLLLTAVAGARVQAKKARARQDVNQITTAWTAYLQEYRRFPNANVTSMNEEAVKILRGPATPHADNPHESIFMDFKTNTVSFRDPWDVEYYVVLDRDKDNKVQVGTLVLHVSVAAWSSGPDKTSYTGDDIVSWAK